MTILTMKNDWNHTEITLITVMIVTLFLHVSPGQYPLSTIWPLGQCDAVSRTFRKVEAFSESIVSNSQKHAFMRSGIDWVGVGAQGTA